MGLRSLMSSLASAAFSAAGDVPQAGVLRATPTHTFSPEADTTTTVWATEDAITVLLYDADLRVEITGSLGPILDRRTGLILLSQITGTVGHGDQIEVDGELWNVFASEPDPAGATATLHLWKGLNQIDGITTEEGVQLITEDGLEVVPET